VSILANLQRLREEIAKLGPVEQEYFLRGADIVLKDSGIDPKLMLGVMTWAYMDLLKQAEEAVADAVRQAVLAVTKLGGGIKDEIPITIVPNKKDLN
jgi:hypothetical protein